MRGERHAASHTTAFARPCVRPWFYTGSSLFQVAPMDDVSKRRWAGERHALASNRVGTSGGVRLDGNRSRPAPSRAIAAAGGLRAPLGGTATHLVGAATDVGDEHAQPTDVVLHQGRHGDTALALDPLWAFAVQNALLL